MFGEGEKTCQKCFMEFLLDDGPQSRRPVEADRDQIKTLTGNYQCNITQETADTLKISKSSIGNDLHQLGYVHHFDVGLPQKLRENLLDYNSAYDSLLKHNENISL